MKKTFLTAILLALAATTAYASGYNVNGTSCVADAGSVENGLYHGTGGTLDFAAGKTGDIVLYCPIPRLDFSPDFIAFLFYDDTGGALNLNFVQVQYIKMSNTTGAITSVATKSSDSVGTTSGGVPGDIGTTITDTYDPDAFAYYVRVDIARNNTTSEEKIYLVDVEGPTP
jgi:hypothetical protein